MKITIDGRTAPLDTANGTELELLFDHVRGLGPEDLRALKAIYDACAARLQEVASYEALAQHEWDLFAAVNERISQVVRQAITAGLSGPVESLQLQLGAAFAHFRTYGTEDFRSFLGPKEDTEARLFSELYKAKFDYDSDDSDQEEDEGAKDYNARTRQAKGARRGTRERPKTARKYDAYDPAYGAVKANMAAVDAKDGQNYCDAFKEGEKPKLASLKDLEPWFKVAEDARAGKKVDYAKTGEITNVFKNLWDKARWNKYVDENACIHHLPGTWTREVEAELERVNEALRNGEDPGESVFVVAQYRGIAYNTVTFDAVARRRSREAVELRLPVYCSSVFKAVGVTPGDYYAGALEDGSEDSNRKKDSLLAVAERLKKALAEKRKGGPITYAGRAYESVALALQNYYTIDYAGFFASATEATKERSDSEEKDDETARTLNEQRRRAVEDLQKFDEARERWSALVAKDKKHAANQKSAEAQKKSAETAKSKAAGTLKAKELANKDGKFDKPIGLLKQEIETQDGEIGKATRELESLAAERRRVAADILSMEADKHGWEDLEATIAEHDKQLRRLGDRKLFKNLLNDANPLVSTGNVPKHALRYAYALKYYTSADGNVRLLPEWLDVDGRARHPYAGKVYVSLHPASDYRSEDGPLDVVALRTAGKLEVEDNIVAERESSFPAMIPAERVVAEHIARYPSFSTDYKPVFADKYGLTKKDYDSFRAMHRLITSNTTREKFFEALGEWLARYHEARLVELARRLAARDGKILVYRDENGLLSRHLSAIKKMEVPATRRPGPPEDGASATLETRTGRDGRHSEERVPLLPQPLEPHPPVPILGIANTLYQCYVNSTLQLLGALDVAANLCVEGTFEDEALAPCVLGFLKRMRDQAGAGTYICETALVERRQVRHTLQNTEFLRVLLATKGSWGSIDRQEDAGEALTFCLDALSSRRALQEFDPSPEGLSEHLRLDDFAARRPSKLHFLVRVTTTYALDGEGLETRPDLEDWYALDQHRALSRLECQNMIQLAVPPDPVEPKDGTEPPPSPSESKKESTVESSGQTADLTERAAVLDPLLEREEAVEEVEAPLTLEALLAEHWDRRYSSDETDIRNNCIFQDRYYPEAPRVRETFTFAGEPPLHLLVQLKRFSGRATLGKIERKVVVGDAVVIGGQRYTLRAFIIHSGKTMEEGHYTAYVQRGDHWYWIDDNRVTEDPDNRAEAASEAYVYYFSR